MTMMVCQPYIPWLCGFLCIKRICPMLLLVLVLQVAELMAKELRWGGSRRRAEVRNAMDYLATFKAPPSSAAKK